ncbi:LuxR C-terminal-related transcriptional regulator [Methylophilus sp. 'Pure River']|uniref:response regulator transcription factor n=1 Tax=Methylophilus sp. 'Pure River' TaxID=3377117 RepID=UPI00398EC6D2
MHSRWFALCPWSGNKKSTDIGSSVYTKRHMLNDSPPPTESAFALRNALKQSQVQLAHDRLFERLGQKLFMHGWSEDLLQWLLDELCMQFGAAHGLISQQHAGALKILAQRGKTFPVGARVPMLGALGQWLKEPIHFEVHAQFVPSLWTLQANTSPAMHCYHLPIACQQRAVGLLGLITGNPLSPSNLQLLHSVCGLLGFALQGHSQTATAIDDSYLQKLTPREREVFALLPSGASNAALAQKLGISPGTVKIHIERILSKLDLNDRTQAAVKAVEAGFKSDGL